MNRIKDGQVEIHHVVAEISSLQLRRIQSRNRVGRILNNALGRIRHNPVILLTSFLYQRIANRIVEQVARDRITTLSNYLITDYLSIIANRSCRLYLLELIVSIIGTTLPNDLAYDSNRVVIRSYCTLVSKLGLQPSISCSIINRLTLLDDYLVNSRNIRQLDDGRVHTLYYVDIADRIPLCQSSVVDERNGITDKHRCRIVYIHRPCNTCVRVSEEVTVTSHQRGIHNDGVTRTCINDLCPDMSSIIRMIINQQIRRTGEYRTTDVMPFVLIRSQGV